MRSQTITMLFLAVHDYDWNSWRVYPNCYDLIKEALGWNILSNQILSWFKDQNIGYLFINYFYWNTLNSTLRAPIRNILHEIFGHRVAYHSQNAIENFVIPDQYNKDNVYLADLFTRVKS